jgi:hypothetical protein
VRCVFYAQERARQVLREVQPISVGDMGARQIREPIVVILVEDRGSSVAEFNMLNILTNLKESPSSGLINPDERSYVEHGTKSNMSL